MSVAEEMEIIAQELALLIGKFSWAEKSGLSIKDRWALIASVDFKVTTILKLLNIEKTRALSFMEKEAV